MKLMKLSEPMRRVILNIGSGDPPWNHVLASSPQGGAESTARALRRRGLIDGDEALTDKGRWMYDRIRPQD